MEEARLAIQCKDNSGNTGTFMYRGDITDKETLEMVSPCFPDSVELYRWADRNGWKEFGGLCGGYRKT